MKFLRKLSGLNKRFISYFLLFSYVPLMIFSVIGYFFNKEFIRNTKTAELKNVLAAVSEEMDRSYNPFVLNDEIFAAEINKRLYSQPKNISIVIKRNAKILFEKKAQTTNEESEIFKNSFWRILYGEGSLEEKAFFKGGVEISVKQSVDVIYARLKKLLHQILIANLAIGILSFIIAVLLAKSISKPIQALVESTALIGKGELHIPVEAVGNDEIKALGKAIDSMRKKLKGSYTNLETKVEERTKALRDAQFQISHQEKMASLGILSAGVAHEVGNPLTSISSLAQIIKRKVNDPTIVEYLDTILKNIQRISKIVLELKEFARPTTYETTFVHINEQIKSAVNIVKYDRRAKNIIIQMELDNDIPPVFAIADQIHQVFLNILMNAVDALTSENNYITIHSYWQKDFVIVEFKDTGEGIAEENISKIFEPFYTTKKVGKGTGLGLSVSYGIIKNFDGIIEVKSQLGEGSVFTIKLPAKETLGA
jgi:signal transduction histidine kinase